MGPQGFVGNPCEGKNNPRLHCVKIGNAEVSIFYSLTPLFRPGQHGSLTSRWNMMTAANLMMILESSQFTTRVAAWRVPTFFIMIS